MQNTITDLTSLHDDASKYISHALAIVVLISNENAYRNVNPDIIENALWNVTDTLTKLDKLFCSVLDDKNSATRDL